MGGRLGIGRVGNLHRGSRHPDHGGTRGPYLPGPSATSGRLGPLEPLLHDVSISDILVNTYDQVFVERDGIRSQLVVPLLSKGQGIGCFEIYRRQALDADIQNEAARRAGIETPSSPPVDE